MVEKLGKTKEEKKSKDKDKKEEQKDDQGGEGDQDKKEEQKQDKKEGEDEKDKQQPDTIKVILEQHEIQLLRDKTGLEPYLENARQLLILSTLTGLRFSDYIGINQSHLRENEQGNYLLVRQKKTREEVKIPLNTESLSLVHKLISGEIHSISNQKINKYVKQVCQFCNIDSIMETHTFRGKEIITENVPKYTLISSHTGRRTFASNLVLKGVPVEIVMRYTGHKDYKSFAKYVNIPTRVEDEMVRLALSS